MIELAIIIVNWNVKDLLKNCLASTLADIATGNLSAEIWVVDNASTDGSVEMLRRDFPQVHLIAGQKNLGFAGGNNAALKAIGFADPPQFNSSSLQNKTDLPEAALLLNPDTEIHPGALQILLDFFKHTPKAGLAGARLVYGDGAFQHSAFAFPGLWQLAIELLPLPGRLVESRLNGRYPRSLYEGERPFHIGHPLGAALCVRREAIRQVGLLDERFHMYVEEVDWSKRIVSAGWEAYCVPRATVTHFGGQSTGQIKTRMFVNLWTSRYQFYSRHYRPLKIWLAAQIVRAGMHRKAAQDSEAAGRGELTQAELSERLGCYQKVIDIWQGRET
ncbi:glycosyltransferase family 2 protein [Chloroflexota bacterium]